jgi:hypothetical protein
MSRVMPRDDANTARSGWDIFLSYSWCDGEIEMFRSYKRFERDAAKGTVLLSR